MMYSMAYRNFYLRKELNKAKDDKRIMTLKNLKSFVFISYSSDRLR